MHRKDKGSARKDGEVTKKWGWITLPLKLGAETPLNLSVFAFVGRQLGAQRAESGHGETVQSWLQQQQQQPHLFTAPARSIAQRRSVYHARLHADGHSLAIALSSPSWAAVRRRQRWTQNRQLSGDDVAPQDGRRASKLYLRLLCTFYTTFSVRTKSKESWQFMILKQAVYTVPGYTLLELRRLCQRQYFHLFN